ncbi:NTP transferase domain-containing protein [Halorubellus sp. JP-L1]|uniref:sugar phosphate nucleotidyltransferase n=1 Tax=Halorubellus sp. JP-L1 TaxID=2715753 RepID=UPI00140A4C9B|nr:sugar phosphate nucleotidyltransferase [Halorubellus sp. JP-L1]NHN43135.1 NTP transferase domain-containing protein [Halorubellus sp. JP-L1]
MQTVLLAAGDGSGLEPVSSSVPKPLLPVAGEPLLQRAARRAVAGGATDLVVVVPPYYQPFTRALGETVDGVTVTYAVQPRPVGTANALVVARRHLDDDFVVLPGDALFDVDDLASLYATVPAVGVTARAEGGDEAMIVGDGGPMDVASLSDDSAGTYVDAGACSLPGEACEWTRVPANDDGERDIAGIVERTADGHDVRPVHLGDYVDVDTPGDLLRANRVAFDEWADATDDPVVEGDVDSQSRLHGAVRVESGASVATGAVVEGPAIVAADATVGPNAYVRPYTYVGPGATLGHSVEVRHSILLSAVHLGPHAFVADSVLAPDVDFGSGTRVANLRHDAPCVVAHDDHERRSTDRDCIGVVAGESASTGMEATLDAGVTLERYASIDDGATVSHD